MAPYRAADADHITVILAARSSETGVEHVAPGLAEM
jgi:hypothetical protein